MRDLLTRFLKMVFVEALEYAHEAIQDIIEAQKKLAELGKPKKEFDLVQVPDDVLSLCREITGNRMEEAIFADSKQERQVAVDKIKEEAATACEEKFGEDYDEDHVKMAFEVIQEESTAKTFSTKENVQMVADLPIFAKLPAKLESCPVFMVLQSLPEEKPSHLFSVLWARAVMYRILMA